MYVFECSTGTHPPFTTTATTSAVRETTYTSGTSIFSTTTEELADTTASETYPVQGGTTAVTSIGDLTTSESTMDYTLTSESTESTTTAEEVYIWDSTSTSAASGYTTAQHVTPPSANAIRVSSELTSSANLLASNGVHGTATTSSNTQRTSSTEDSDEEALLEETTTTVHTSDIEATTQAKTPLQSRNTTSMNQHNKSYYGKTWKTLDIIIKYLTQVSNDVYVSLVD